MTTETMTIHKALSELKILDDRINKAIAQPFVTATKHSNEKINGVSIDDFKKVLSGNYDKVTDLIARRNAIKHATVLSNAKATVRIGSNEYTVAEAIEMKNHGMEFKQSLMNQLVAQYNSANYTVAQKNGDDLDKRAENYVVGIYGSKEGKTDTADFEKAKRDFVTSNTFELVDPNKVLDKISALETEIAEFTSEVDAALSTSNALTTIEITY